MFHSSTGIVINTLHLHVDTTYLLVQFANVFFLIDVQIRIKLHLVVATKELIFIVIQLF